MLKYVLPLKIVTFNNCICNFDINLFAIMLNYAFTSLNECNSLIIFGLMCLLNLFYLFLSLKYSVITFGRMFLGHPVNWAESLSLTFKWHTPFTWLWNGRFCSQFLQSICHYPAIIVLIDPFCWHSVNKFCIRHFQNLLLTNLAIRIQRSKLCKHANICMT